MSHGVFVQATAVALDGHAVLLLGPPGCGKSDLALRLIGRGAALIADDGVVLRVIDHRLVAEAPGNRVPRLHVAGIGMVEVAPAASTPVALAVTLDPALVPHDRSVPLSMFGPVHSLCVPQIALPALHASTPDKLLLALDRWGH
jgi:HPr kinase/phosphorylase